MATAIVLLRGLLADSHDPFPSFSLLNIHEIQKGNEAIKRKQSTREREYRFTVSEGKPEELFCLVEIFYSIALILYLRCLHLAGLCDHVDPHPWVVLFCPLRSCLESWSLIRAFVVIAAASPDSF